MGEDEILLSYCDMHGRGLLSKNFPTVPKVKTATVKKVKVVVKVKKVTKKKNIKKRKPNGDMAPLSGGIVHHTATPCERDSGSNGTSMKSTMARKK